MLLIDGINHSYSISRSHLREKHIKRISQRKIFVEEKRKKIVNHFSELSEGEEAKVTEKRLESQNRMAAE